MADDDFPGGPEPEAEQVDDLRDGVPPSIASATYRQLEKLPVSKGSGLATLALDIALRLDGRTLTGSERAALSREYRILMTTIMGSEVAKSPDSVVDELAERRSERQGRGMA